MTLSILVLDSLGLLIGSIAVVRLPRDSWRRDLALFGGLGLALAFTAALMGMKIPHSGFAVLRLWTHVLFCILAPLAILRGILLCRTSRSRATTWIVIGLLFEGVFVYSREIEPYWLEVTEYRIETDALHPGTRPLRIAVLADLQTDVIGEYEKRVFRELDALEADLILLPGDYIQAIDPEVIQEVRHGIRELFGSLTHRPPLGIYGVDGDVDFAAPTFAGTRAQALADEQVHLREDLQLIALATPSSRQHLAQRWMRSIETFEGLTILLGHAPDFTVPWIRENSAPENIMAIAGHTHGGQVTIPGFGPILTLSRVPRQFASGLNALGPNSSIFVSRGVGLERGMAPRIRLFCRPELALLEITPRS